MKDICVSTNKTNLHTRIVGYSYAIEFDAGMDKNLALKEAHDIIVRIEK